MTSKPIVLCDADGVLLNFTQAYLDVLYDITGEEHMPFEVTEWDFHKCAFFVELEKKWPDLKRSIQDVITNEDGFCRNIPVLAGAPEGFAKLREIAEVFVVTSPWHSSPTWMSERTASLYENFGVKASHVVHASSKHIVSGAMLIDDKIGNLINWHHGRAVLWNAHHNLDVYIEGTHVTRAYDWNSVVAMAGRL